MSLITGLLQKFRAPRSAARALVIAHAGDVPYVLTLLRMATPPITPVGAVAIKPDEPAAPGICTLGSLDQLDAILAEHPADVAYICLPAAMSGLANRIASQVKTSGGARILPTLRDQLEGRVGRPAGHIDFNQLLDRPHRRLDELAIDRTLRHKRVLITGAGGSIGSHIARIVARFDPALLVLMDRSENSLFEIDRRMAADFPGVQRRAVLHDVADARRTSAVVAQFEPQVVFHAAAHKHVPMMEDHPREAVINNLFGTKSIVDAAVEHHAERFVMISTDKAVNPSSVMGSTKRLAELYVQHMAERGSTMCSMVRFGNVLGSACSVVPIWTQQLTEGGPLTVTDPRMTRYFMTIPEAAALVIQAASIDRNNGSIFVLDMGQPIRIVDMAERFVRMHGLEPGRDVQITFTGARPGEKLYEELAYNSEEITPTACDGVQLLRTIPPARESVMAMIRTFEALRHTDDRNGIVAAIRHALSNLNTQAAEAHTAPPVRLSA
jgi:FlaA1/EpsC-like NDP-sugar epimerase